MDHYKYPSLNHFTTRSVDRVARNRRDDEWLAVRLQDASTRFIPVWRSKNLFVADQMTEPVFLRPHQVQGLVGTAGARAVLLGVDGSRAYFAIDVSSGENAPPPALAAHGQFRDLRRVAALLDERHCALLAYAKGIIHWHHRHRFCGDCGSPTASVDGGSVRVCTSEACGRQHFPRVDPAIIVLVAAEDRCLLGRKPEWPAGRYSTIAGFVEPGESLEAAVIREVREETGIDVDEVRYFASQPWPFPSSLMLGFTARGVSEEIHVGEDELEDARWFTREQLRDSLRQGTVELPFRLAISYHLIAGWFDAGDLGSLGDISGD